MGLRWLLKRFGVFSNDYYNYLKDRKVAYRKRKENLLNCMTETYHERKGAPGYRLMADQNQSDNVPKYMNCELKLFSVTRRHRPGFRKETAHKVFENLLKRQFTVPLPDKFWCTDFTYIPLKNGSMRYNSVILDLYDRSVTSTL